MADTVEVELNKSVVSVKRAIARTQKALTAGQRERVRGADPVGILIDVMKADETEQGTRIDIAKFLTNKIMPTPMGDRPGTITDAEAGAWLKRLPATQ